MAGGRMAAPVVRLESSSRPPTAGRGVGRCTTARVFSASSTASFRLAIGAGGIGGLSSIESKWRASSDALRPLASNSPSATGVIFSALLFVRGTRTSLRTAEFHRFLIALSVRPGIIFTINDHFVPCIATASRIIRSSSSVNVSLRTSGARWLCQRSRHCLPTRPSKLFAISLQHEGPCMPTSSMSRWSSSGVHACFLIWPRCRPREAAPGRGWPSLQGDALKVP
mmetsp:Transcript_11479/g.22226  ORF Transcript_11479/g.22226 Transcript_11479/m.22226 type:complete len:225 (+) Transcript_11479:3-677(+)